MLSKTEETGEKIMGNHLPLKNKQENRNLQAIFRGKKIPQKNNLRKTLLQKITALCSNMVHKWTSQCTYELMTLFVSVGW